MSEPFSFSATLVCAAAHPTAEKGGVGMVSFFEPAATWRIDGTRIIEQISPPYFLRAAEGTPIPCWALDAGGDLTGPFIAEANAVPEPAGGLIVGLIALAILARAKGRR